MILSKEVKIKISKKTITYFKSKGHDVELNEFQTIKVEDLSKGSHVKIKVKCDICGKEKELAYQKYNKNISNGGYYACCSKCSQSKVKETSIKKFGSEYYSQTKEFNDKIKETSIEKYGVEHFTQNENVKNKQKKTNLKNYGVSSILSNGEKREQIKKNWIKEYGVDNPSKSEKIKEKISNINKENSKQVQKKVRKTNLERYGVEYLFNDKNFQNNIRKIIKERYGVDNVFKSKSIQDKIKKTNFNKRLNKSINFYQDKYDLNIQDIDYEERIYTLKCEKCDLTYNMDQSLLNNRLRGNTIVCPICNPINSSKSGLEIQLFKFLKENYDGEILRNKRKPLNNEYELDFYLPDLKIAFEFNGLWWHSEENKDKYYHKNKADKCFEKNIKLIYIWEDEWLFDRENVENNILVILNDINLDLNLFGEFVVESNTFDEFFFFKDGFKIKELLEPKLCYKTGLNNKIFNIYNSGNIILYK